MLHFGNFFFLRLEQFVDAGNRAVNDLLELFHPAELLVLGDDLVLLELFQVLFGIAADRAQRHPAAFGHLVDQLHQLLATFLGQLRYG